MYKDPIKQAFRDFVQDKLILRNACTDPCDVLFEGPCCCGAVHSPEELPYRCGLNVWDVIAKACNKNNIMIPGDVDPDIVRGLNKKEW